MALTRTLRPLVKDTLDAMRALKCYARITALFKKLDGTRFTTVTSASVSARGAGLDHIDACTLNRCLNIENMSNLTRLDLSGNAGARHTTHAVHATATQASHRPKTQPLAAQRAHA
jgi:hypothetical protein